MRKIELEEDVGYILEILQKYGEGYIVGGYVRDKLLGLSPKDCDFVTNLPYEKLMEIFKEFHPKEIGRAFGIIQIKYNGKIYEIAKYRRDIGVPEDRREQRVEFTQSIIEDLKRRDFTINAIAFDGENYKFVEGAFEDIEKRELHFVGKPEERIQEDPLRILRFIRFITEKKLKNSCDISLLLPYGHLVEKLSMERIREEFNKILLSENVVVGLELLEKSGVLEYLIPQWKDVKGFDQRNPHHNLTVDEHIKKVVENVENDLELRLSALLHDIGKPYTFTIKDGRGHFYGHEIESGKIAEEILMRMKYPNRVVKNVTLLVRYHLNNFKFSGRKYVKRLVEELGHENISKLFKLMESDRLAHRPPYDFRSLEQLKRLYQEICEKKEPVSMRELAINGEDIMALGVERGKRVGEVLKFLLNEVLEKPEINEREILLKLAKQYLSASKNF